MNRFAFPILLLGVLLAPVLCLAAEPNANQPPAPPIPPPGWSPPDLTPQPEPPVAAADLLPKSRDNDAALLKAAQDERVKVLTQTVEVLTSQYKAALVDFIQLSSAQDELCDALLDSTEEPEKRVALLTKQLGRANDVVKLVEARHAAGTVTDMDVFRAKSQYLGIKIKLLKERSGKRPPTAQTADNARSGCTLLGGRAGLARHVFRR
ncbi:MAG: hypothetical protein ACLP9L_18850 [Thermoguttaceae bacterium]